MSTEQLKDGRPPFTIIDDRVFTLGLSPQAGWLYTAICSFAHKGKPTAYPSVKTLAEMTGMSENTVRKYRGELLDRGLIHMQARATEDGRQTSNLYTIVNINFVGAPSQIEPSPLQTVNPPPSQIAHEEEQENKNNRKKKADPGSLVGASTPEPLDDDETPPGELLKAAYKDAHGDLRHATLKQVDEVRLSQLSSEGITPKQLRDFITYKRTEDYWRGQRIPTKVIVNDIGAWLSGSNGFVHRDNLDTNEALSRLDWFDAS